MELKLDRNTFFKPTNKSQTTQGIQAYDTLTTYLKPIDKNLLEKGLNELKEDGDFFLSLARKINLGNWQSLFNENNSELFPLYALRCLKDGLITPMTFSTSQLFYTVLTHEENKNLTDKPMEFIEALNANQKRTQRADKMIDATMRIAPSAALLRMKLALQESGSSVDQGEYAKNVDLLKQEFGEAYYWTPLQKKQFYLNLLKYPASEHSFLLVNDSFIVDGASSVMDVINFDIGFNALSRLTINDKLMRIIPSRGMMQAYLEAINPKTTPKPIYRFGLSTLSGLHNTLKDNGRDLFQSFTLLAHLTPAIVDSRPASTRYVEAELHDFYHQMRISHIPLNDRNVLNCFADKLLAIAKSQTPRNKVASALAAQIIDMEHSYYDLFDEKRTKYHERLNEIFIGAKTVLILGERRLEPVDNPNLRLWLSLNLCFNTVKDSRPLTPNTNELEETQKGLVAWMLYDESLCNPKMQSMFEELSFSKSLTSFSKELQDRMHAQVLKEIEEPCIHHWMKVWNGLTENTLRERLLYKFCLGKIAAGVEKLFTLTVDECYRFHTVYQDTYLKSKTMLQRLLVNHIVNKFTSFLESGVFATLEKQHNNAFVWLMQTINPSSQQYDTLIGLSIKHNQTFLFDALYHKTCVNIVFQSDKTTMLHRALAEENIELMMRLTNDGAKPFDIKTYVNPNDETYFKTHPKMCPFERSLLHGRFELIALLYFAAKSEIGGGIGWMERNPEVVERFRRLSSEDFVWINDLVSKIPLHLYETKHFDKACDEIIGASEIERAFKNKISGKHGHIEIDPKELDALVKLRKWREKGGDLPEKETPRFGFGT